MPRKTAASARAKAHLGFAVLRIPYLSPCQLDVGMEQNKSTAALDMYCYIRISQDCSHQDALPLITTDSPSPLNRVSISSVIIRGLLSGSFE
ncbi:hypothetical protein F5Y14DRAFT_273316 [Nemania sp. NC0429]|nr:hypothetical protein F5Y14DRAFT_273316 [Nemania sp. NC0429]